MRYGVVAFALLLASVTYLDRVAWASFKSILRTIWNSATYQMGLVFGAFALAYALFEIPTARWADRRGTRRVLIRIVVWWSAFTIATAAAFNFVSMLVTQFLFGAGEAGAWPSVTSTFARWIPAKERGRVQGIFFTGADLSAATCAVYHCHARGVLALAVDLRDLRLGRIFVGGGVVPLVPRRSVASIRKSTRRSEG